MYPHHWTFSSHTMIDHFRRVFDCGYFNADHKDWTPSLSEGWVNLGSTLPGVRGKTNQGRHNTLWRRKNQSPLSPSCVLKKKNYVDQSSTSNATTPSSCSTRRKCQWRGGEKVKKKKGNTRKIKIDTDVGGCCHRSMWRERNYKTKIKGNTYDPKKDKR